jgi:FMN phosphatase YigB (HAD superfamily)
LKITLRTFPSVLRILVGAVRFPWAWRSRHEECRLVSVDVFATLLSRVHDDAAAWRAGAMNLVQRPHLRGLRVVADPIALRQQQEAAISARMIAAGMDPEFLHRESLESMLHAMGEVAGERDVEDCAQRELEWEAALTRPITPTVSWVAEQAAQGRRVVAVSDSRYSAEEIFDLLRRHGVRGVSRVYSSGDHGVSKFSGRLFDLVSARERVPHKEILHVGDNILTDGMVAAQRGMRVRILRTPSSARAGPLPVAPEDVREAEPGFQVGYRTLGPIIVAFTRLVLHRAAIEGVRRLLFVARDGDLPCEVACRFMDSPLAEHKPELVYIHLSRRAVACALADLSRAAIDEDAMRRVIASVRAVRGEGTLLERMCSYLGLPRDDVYREAQRLGLRNGNAEDIELLLRDPQSAVTLQRAIRQARETLIQYLRQVKVFDRGSALVDIGWRGSIQSTLAEIAAAEGLPAPCGYYLGLWNEGGALEIAGTAHGVLCDQRKSRGILEGAAWHAAFLLEAVCRADHGMVTGFARSAQGDVTPVHTEQGSTRAAEQRSEVARKRIRDGVLAYVDWFAQEPVVPPIAGALRRAAQKRLLRLAFFPSQVERAVGHNLYYTEPTSDDWACSLIMSAGRGFKARLAGVRSPWKGGYFREAGGLAAACLYFGCEWILGCLPAGTKLKLRNLLIGEG